MRTAMRIADAVEAQKQIVLKRRHDFEIRQTAGELRKKQFEQWRHRRINEARERGEQKSSEISLVLEKMEQIEEDRKQQIVRKEKESHEFMQKARSERAAEQMEHSEAQRLKLADKLEAVERLKRIDNYKREQALLKIKRDNARTEAVKKAKEEMIEQRRAVKRASEMLRQKALLSFDKIKVQAQSKASSPNTKSKSKSSAR